MSQKNTNSRTAEQYGHNDRARRSVVAELRQEPSGPVGKSAGDTDDAPEVLPGEFKELTLLLEMEVIRVFESEKAIDGDA